MFSDDFHTVVVCFSWDLIFLSVFISQNQIAEGNVFKHLKEKPYMGTGHVR